MQKCDHFKTASPRLHYIDVTSFYYQILDLLFLKFLKSYNCALETMNIAI